jgi:pyridoxine kinase
MKGQGVSPAYVERIADALLEIGRKECGSQGVMRGDEKIRNYVCGRNFTGVEIASELVAYILHGTGDLYASGVLAAVMCGRSLYDAVALQVHSSLMPCQHAQQPDFEVRG